MWQGLTLKFKHIKEKDVKKFFSKYSKYILMAADKFHENGNHRPQIKDYRFEVLELMKANNRKNIPEDKQARYQISRALKRMSEGTNNDLLCINEKYYVLNNDTYFQEKLIEECYEYFKKLIIVKRKDIIRISYNMCALSVELKADDDTNTIGSIFKDYLDDACFDVLECENLLFVLLKCDPESKEIPKEDSREHMVIKTIEAAIEKIYNDQEHEGKRQLQRQRARKKSKKDE